jgi:hypothetical protein
MARTKQEKREVTRITLDLDPLEYQALVEIAKEKGISQAAVLRKGIRVVIGLDNKEYHLHTKGGERIPSSIVFY